MGSSPGTGSDGPWVCWRCRYETAFPHPWCGTTAACHCDECISPTTDELAKELVRKFRDWEFDGDGQPIGPAHVWMIYSPTGEDDYGSPLPPVVMAVATSEPKADRIRGELWGGGQLDSTYTEQIRTDEMIPD